MTAAATWRRAAAAAIAIGGLAVTGCDGGGGSQPRVSATAPSVDAALAALVPAHLKAKGKVVIATDASYAPMEFKDAQGRIVGVDVDLGEAVADRLGLDAEFKDAKFDGIIGRVQAGKYDLAMSDFAATQERQKAVDMVTYFTSGSAVAVRSGNPDRLDAALLCGVRVAVQAGSIQAEDVKNTRNPKCRAEGKPPIPGDGDKFDLQTQVAAALLAGRVSAMIADNVAVNYAVKASGQIEQLGGSYNVSPSAIVIPKGDGKLAQAVQRAVQALIDDGTYGRILDKWDLESNAVTTSVVNGATS
ncbi:ABC transporter substrate-binding protein [Streptomyces sp. SID13588]|nr:ABC transporter substrate-binding protein [Streptomyces sp. SID13588]